MKNTAKLIVCVLVILTSSAFAITHSPQQIGPWSMDCISTQAAQDNSAFDAIKNKTFQMCAAKQIVQKNINGKNITATFVVSPVFTSFSVKNISIKGTKAYLLIGKNDPVTLNSFCRTDQKINECFFMMRDKNINIDKVMSLLDGEKTCQLQFMNAATNKPTNIEFSLKEFDQVHATIQNAESNMKNAFQPATTENTQ